MRRPLESRRLEKPCRRARRRAMRHERSIAPELSRRRSVKGLWEGMKGQEQMRKQVRRRHEAHLRAQNVCAEYSAFFDANPGGQKARADHAAQMTEVDRLLTL